MNILLLSNNEDISFKLIYLCARRFPSSANWLIAGNVENHKELVSIFGKEKFIHIPVDKLPTQMHDQTDAIGFLADRLEKFLIIPTDFRSLRFLSVYQEYFALHTVCPILNIQLIHYLDDKTFVPKISSECELISPNEYTIDQLNSFLQIIGW